MVKAWDDYIDGGFFRPVREDVTGKPTEFVGAFGWLIHRKHPPVGFLSNLYGELINIAIAYNELFSSKPVRLDAVELIANRVHRGWMGLYWHRDHIPLRDQESLSSELLAWVRNRRLTFSAYARRGPKGTLGDGEDSGGNLIIRPNKAECDDITESVSKHGSGAVFWPSTTHKVGSMKDHDQYGKACRYSFQAFFHAPVDDE